MSKPKDHDVSKLPLWAQHLLQQKDDSIRLMKEALHTALEVEPGMTGETGITVRKVEREVNLPRGSHVRFYIPDPTRNRPHEMEVSVEGSAMCIRSPTGMLILEPSAGNTVLVGINKLEETIRARLGGHEEVGSEGGRDVRAPGEQGSEAAGVEGGSPRRPARNRTRPVR